MALTSGVVLWHRCVFTVISILVATHVPTSATIGSAFMRDYSDFLAVRALLGVFEGGMIPYVKSCLSCDPHLLSHSSLVFLQWRCISALPS